MGAYDERDFLVSRIADAADIADRQQVPHFIGFLDEAGCAQCQTYLKKHRLNAALFGGYDRAERRVLGVFPAWDTPGEDAFPVKALTVRWPEEYPLSHRDFLGALLSMGIERKSVGDIRSGDGIAVLFVLEAVFPYVFSQLDKVGSVRVKLSQDIPEPLPIKDRFKEITAAVSSERLDCAVGALVGVSRAESAELIKSGLVKRNFYTETSVTARLKNGDIVFVRGHGKYILDDLTGLTKKGKIRLAARKYI